MGQQQESEWIEHDGGPCPVDPDTRVIAKFRDGKVDDIKPARAGFWSRGSYDWWKHEGPDLCHNIVAYRVVRA